MAEQDIILVDPTEALEGAFYDFMDEYRAAGEVFRGADPEEVRFNFAAYVQKLRNYALGVGLREGYVSENIYWLVRAGRILGTCRLRHRLTESLRDLGGHIGYGVRPSERSKGCATRMLSLCLDKARQRNLRRVMITCRSDNLASARVIEKKDGVLESESPCQATGQMTRRYWIEL